jgi:hypothetical protein
MEPHDTKAASSKEMEKCIHGIIMGYAAVLGAAFN